MTTEQLYDICARLRRSEDCFYSDTLDLILPNGDKGVSTSYCYEGPRAPFAHVTVFNGSTTFTSRCERVKAPLAIHRMIAEHFGLTL